MNRTVLIYAIIRRENGDAYVGSTIALSQRWAHHRSTLKKGRHHCRHLQHAWNKYGADSFDYVILERAECSTRQERNFVELSWIERMGCYNHLVSDGRSGCFVVRPEDLEARRASAFARIAADPAYRAWLGERGKAIAELARTPAAREAMAKTTTLRWQDPEEREKLAAGLVNRWADPNARDHMAKKTGERMRQPENGAAHSEKLKAAWQDPDKRARLQARLDSRWADPEAKARQAANMKRIWAERRAAKAAAA
jgi:hypothetical protein